MPQIQTLIGNQNENTCAEEISELLDCIEDDIKKTNDSEMLLLELDLANLGIAIAKHYAVPDSEIQNFRARYYKLSEQYLSKQ